MSETVGMCVGGKPPAPHSVYRIYGSNDLLLYVGRSNNWARRLVEHRKSQPWWDQVTRVEPTDFATEQQAIDAERIAIQTERPLYNVVHNRKTPRRDSTTKWELRWRCDVCNSELGNKGYLQFDAKAWAWRADCRGCDPLGDAAGYVITTDRILTLKQYDDWTLHLKHKTWFDERDWRYVYCRSTGRR